MLRYFASPLSISTLIFWIAMAILIPALWVVAIGYALVYWKMAHAASTAHRRRTSPMRKVVMPDGTWNFEEVSR